MKGEWILWVIAYAGWAAHAMLAAFVVALPIAGIFLLIRRRYLIAAICFGLVAALGLNSFLDWRTGDQAAVAFGTPQVLAPIARSRPLVLVDNFIGCGPRCRQLLGSGHVQIVYNGESRGGSPGNAKEPPRVRRSFTRASGAACSGPKVDWLDRQDKSAGCVVAHNVSGPPGSYVRVTIANFPIRRLYELGFPKTTNTFHEGTFFLVIENVSGETAELAAWAARVVREPQTFIPGVSLLTHSQDLQVVGNQEPLKPTLERLLGVTLR